MAPASNAIDKAPYALAGDIATCFMEYSRAKSSARTVSGGYKQKRPAPRPASTFLNLSQQQPPVHAWSGRWRHDGLSVDLCGEASSTA